MTNDTRDALKELRACPFCGADDAKLDNLVDDDDWFVSCPICEIQQIANYTKAQAVALWNRRVSTTASDRGGEREDALVRARNVLRGVATRRSTIGPLATAAQQCVFQINEVLSAPSIPAPVDEGWFRAKDTHGLICIFGPGDGPYLWGFFKSQFSLADAQELCIALNSTTPPEPADETLGEYPYQISTNESVGTKPTPPEPIPVTDDGAIALIAARHASEKRRIALAAERNLGADTLNFTIAHGDRETLLAYIAAFRRTVPPVGTRDKAVALIQKERDRQINVEGWTPQHDDEEHDDGEMLRAAVIYLHWETDRASPMVDQVPMGWPWGVEWWKPRDRVSNLTRAGALALAEMGRIKRATARENSRRAYIDNHNGNISANLLAPIGHVEQKYDLIVAALTEALPATPPR